MPVTSLDNTTQLLQQKPIQLGTSDDPCTILFGLSEIDTDKPWRTIKVVPNEADLKVLKSFDADHDDLHDIVKEHDGTDCINVKVNLKLTKAFDDTKTKADLDVVLSQDTQLKIIVRPRRWKMNDQSGVAFRAAICMLVADLLRDVRLKIIIFSELGVCMGVKKIA